MLTRMRTHLRRLLGDGPAATPAIPPEAGVSAEDQRIAESVRGYTMTGNLRVYSLLDAVRYVVARRVPGAFVECGVWRGGSVMAMASKLLKLGITDRELFLYDTFEGMAEPTAADTSGFEPPALATWQQARDQGERAWNTLFRPDLYSEPQVRANVLGTGYPADRLRFVKGKVEDTIPRVAPDRIALLRLDTDWYESTRHELEHLYPRLQAGGVLIIDDYGHWDGCRKAVDEYFAGGRAEPVLLQRIDYTGRLAVKP